MRKVHGYMPRWRPLWLHAHAWCLAHRMRCSDSDLGADLRGAAQRTALAERRLQNGACKGDAGRATGRHSSAAAGRGRAKQQRACCVMWFSEVWSKSGHPDRIWNSRQKPPNCNFHPSAIKRCTLDNLHHFWIVDIAVQHSERGYVRGSSTGQLVRRQ